MTTPIIVQAAVVTSRNCVLAKAAYRRRQRGDQGVDTKERRDHAVGRADPDADDDAHEDGEHRIAGNGHLHRDHLAQRVRRADRQVDTAADQLAPLSDLHSEAGTHPCEGNTGATD
jgi:hypothetical protein